MNALMKSIMASQYKSARRAMAKAIEFSVRPRVLKWARETSGAAIEDAAKRLRVAPSTYAEWEGLESRLRLSQLRTLSAYFKRPLAAFLLSDPPQEPGPPHDFRTLPGSRRTLERKTRFAIRKAQRLQIVAKELMRATGRVTAPQLGKARVGEPLDGTPGRERDRVGINIEKQLGWTNEWEAFREWRTAVEHNNILVFQFPMPLEDARGFSSADEGPYAIVLGSSDAVRGRIFTLFHEYGHLLLHTPGICLPQLDGKPQKQDTRIERWCNSFAGNFLVPDVGPVASQLGSNVLEGQALYEALGTVAREFKVSEQVALSRLRDLGVVPRQQFHAAIERLTARAKQKKRGGVVLPARRCLAENGSLFTSLVLEARGKGFVTYSDVTDYLEVPLKHLPQIETALAAVAV